MAGGEEEVDPELEEIEKALRENEAAGVNGSAVPSASPPAIGEPHRPQDAPRKGPGRRQPPVRRRKGMQEVSASAGTPPPVGVIGEPPGEELDEGGTGTKDAMVVWPRVLEKQKALGYQPEAIGITVARIATGPQKAPRVQLAPIDGSIVAGDGNTSPGEALYDYIVGYYHLSSGGPAVYHLNFYYRSGGGTIRGSAELPLDHPDVIVRQRQAVEKAKYDRAVAAGGYPGPAPMPFGLGGRAPFGAAGVGAGTPAAPVPAPNLNENENRLFQELLQKTGFYEGYMKAQKEAEARAPAPAAPVPTPVRDPNAKPPGLTDEEWTSIQRTRLAKDMGPAIAQAVTASLVGVGLTPDVIQNLKQLGSAPAAAVAAGPGPAPYNPKDPFNLVAGLESFVTVMKHIGVLQEKVQEALPTVAGRADEEKKEPEEKDETKLAPIAEGLLKYDNGQPMMYAKKGEDESSVEWLTRIAIANQPMFEKIASKIPPDVFGRVMDAVMRKQAAAAAAPTPALGQKTEKPAKGWVPD